MNAPSGFTLGSDGKVVEVDPIQVIFNDSMPLQAAHMVIAAYLVGGFLVASVYATGMLRGRRDRYHHLGFVIAFSVGAVAAPIQMGIGDSLARRVYNNQPVKFAAIELVPKTSSDVPETLLGRPNEDGTVSGGLPIPGLASWLSDPSTGRSTVVQGLDTVPADQRPTIRQTNTVHLAWDVMVGLGSPRQRHLPLRLIPDNLELPPHGIRFAASASSRLFPAPGSPTTSTAAASPALAARPTASSLSSSCARPTNALMPGSVRPDPADQGRRRG